MDLDTLHIAIRLADFAALFCGVGLLLARLALLPAEAFADAGIARRWHRVLSLALMLMTLTAPALAVVRVMEMGGTGAGEAVGLLPAVLRQTHFGKAWLAHCAGLLALWLCWIALARSPRRWPARLMLALLYALMLSYSATSHAADAGDFTAPEWIDSLHLAAAASWGGGVFAAVLFLFPALARDAARRRRLLDACLRRLSALSATALAVVVASGVVNTRLRLGGLAPLLDSSYGHVLLGKILLVAAMAALGGINRFFLIPRVSRWAKRAQPGGADVLRWLLLSLRIDAVLVLLILAAAAMLIGGMPPAAEHAMPMTMGHAHD
jgi:putative copper resistance protein D